jgi:hypothetical protein
MMSLLRRLPLLRKPQPKKTILMKMMTMMMKKLSRNLLKKPKPKPQSKMTEVTVLNFSLRIFPIQLMTMLFMNSSANTELSKLLK